MAARKQAQNPRGIRLDDPAATVPPAPPGNALHRYRQISRGLIATDAACLVIALLIGYYLRYDNRPMPIGESLTVLFAGRRHLRLGSGVLGRPARAPGRQRPRDRRHITREAFRWVDQRILVDGRPEGRLAGYGFSMRRQRLLDVLTRRGAGLGVEVRFEHEVEDEASLDGHDLVVAADGVNSRLRRAHPGSFGTRIDTGCNRYMWLGTTKVFDSFTFAFVPTPAGWI